MTKQKSTKKAATGKAKGSKGTRRPTVKERARAIVADKRYFDETRHAIQNSLDENSSDLAELVRRAEGGELILDARGPVGNGATEGHPDTAAIVYAQKAYNTALEHYYAHQDDPFTLSRLAVIYGEQQPGDFHLVVTLPGATREDGPQESHVRRLIKDAERIARTLEDSECSEAYREAFGSIYVNHLLNISGVELEHPAVVRVLLPLVMLDLWDDRPADADTALEILSITLRDALNSDEVCERTRAANG